MTFGVRYRSVASKNAIQLLPFVQRPREQISVPSKRVAGRAKRSGTSEANSKLLYAHGENRRRGEHVAERGERGNEHTRKHQIGKASGQPAFNGLHYAGWRDGTVEGRCM